MFSFKHLKYITYSHHIRPFDNQIEIKATPSGGVVNGSRKTKKPSAADHTLKGAPPKIPYEPTIKDKMCFKAITFMKVGIVFFFYIDDDSIFLKINPIHLGIPAVFI